MIGFAYSLVALDLPLKHFDTFTEKKRLLQANLLAILRRIVSDKHIGDLVFFLTAVSDI